MSRLFSLLIRGGAYSFFFSKRGGAHSRGGGAHSGVGALSRKYGILERNVYIYKRNTKKSKHCRAKFRISTKSLFKYGFCVQGTQETASNMSDTVILGT